MASRLFYTGPRLSALHEEYAKKGTVDERAPVVATSETVVDAPAGRVWEVVSDVASWPSWYPGFELLELSSVAVDAPFRWKVSGAKIRSTFAVVEPERELTWTGVFFGAKAVHRHVLDALDEDHTRVRVEESMAMPMLPLIYNAGKLTRDQQRWLAAMKARVEGGGGD